MQRVFVSLLYFLPLLAVASENLTQQDYDGHWVSNYSAVKNEKQVLIISLSGESVFERHFESSSTQIFKTRQFKLLEDLLVLNFISPDNGYAYKLALSGWKTRSKKVLYGSMFMYRNGKQFNMLPVSYEHSN